MRHNPYKIVTMFEETVADYCGAPYAVAIDSCTNAIFLALRYTHNKMYGPSHYPTTMPKVTIPARTYLSVPQSCYHAGYQVEFEDVDWSGAYQIKPTSVWDSAKRLTSGMYQPGTLMCLSFHIKKLLGLGKGGMILTDNKDAVEYLKCARYEGRHEVNYKDDDITSFGWNMYMCPSVAARGLMLMQNYPEHVDDLPEPGGYRDLREFTLFKDLAKFF